MLADMAKVVCGSYFNALSVSVKMLYRPAGVIDVASCEVDLLRDSFGYFWAIRRWPLLC